ncbi:MAG: DUF4440 domain-containing protein [Pyrinomonadaceae bacterium]
MKRILLPAALLCCVAACAPAPTDNTNANANMNANMSNMNASNANTSSTATTQDAELIAKEKELYDDFKKKDMTAFGAMLADDFMYVSSDGVHDKAATVKLAGMSGISDAALTDFKVLHIDKDAAAVIYNSDVKGTREGKAYADKSRESSVWVNRGGKWVAIFHQDCLIGPPMPPPPTASSNSNTSANANKATAASPVASPATTSSDVEANEKMVWAAIKRQDANGFASFLADDALEVEADKVYTKSESASTVTSLPFLAGTTLSDFKTVKIDDDASIVTYTAKGTGPDKKPFTEHHSTVWSNHGGKWLAALHHGTTVGAMMPAPSPTK